MIYPTFKFSPTIPTASVEEHPMFSIRIVEMPKPSHRAGYFCGAFFLVLVFAIAFVLHYTAGE